MTSDVQYLACLQIETWYVSTNVAPPLLLYSYSLVVFAALTSLVLYTSQVPHDGLLSVVRLAGITRGRSDALVSNSVDI